MDEQKEDLVKRYFMVAYDDKEAEDLVEFIKQTPDELDRIYKNIQRFFIELAEENGYISPDCIDSVCADMAAERRENREDAYS